jgi:ketosteroid isomerase-like protein
VDELQELRHRIQVLEDKEAIRKLKATYWLSLDRKQYEDFANCFAEDATIAAPSGGKVVGRKEILKTLPAMMDALITVHHGHHYDIELTSATTARATWAMYDNLQALGSHASREGFGWYDEEYVKVDGEWKIKFTTLSRAFVVDKRLSRTDTSSVRQPAS